MFRPVQDSLGWLGLMSREQLMSPECSKHQVLSFAKMLVVNKQKNILFSSVLMMNMQNLGSQESVWVKYIVAYTPDLFKALV